MFLSISQHFCILRNLSNFHLFLKAGCLTSEIFLTADRISIVSTCSSFLSTTSCRLSNDIRRRLLIGIKFLDNKWFNFLADSVSRSSHTFDWTKPELKFIHFRKYFFVFMFILSYEAGFYKPTVLKVHSPISGITIGRKIPLSLFAPYFSSQRMVREK